MEEIAQGTATATWTVVDRLVLHEGRLFVSSSSLLWPKHLATAHGAGHKGVQKTLQRLHVSYSPNAMYLVSRGKSRNKFRGGFLLLPLLRGLHWISSGRGTQAYIVCNLATKQWVTVPSSGWTPSPLNDLTYTYLGFDPAVSSHSQLVEFTQDD